MLEGGEGGEIWGPAAWDPGERNPDAPGVSPSRALHARDGRACLRSGPLVLNMHAAQIVQKSTVQFLSGSLFSPALPYDLKKVTREY